MERLLASGKVKAIGVSNYSKRYLEQLLAHASVVPAVNQIENHPALPQQEIVDLCRAHGIHVTAYSPLGSTGGPLFTAEGIVSVARRRGVSPAAVLLSWHGGFLVRSLLGWANWGSCARFVGPGEVGDAVAD